MNAAGSAGGEVTVTSVKMPSWLRVPRWWQQVPDDIKPVLLFGLLAPVVLSTDDTWGYAPLYALTFVGLLFFSLPEDRLRSIMRTDGLLLAGAVFVLVNLLFPVFHDRVGTELFYEASSPDHPSAAAHVG